MADGPAGFVQGFTCPALLRILLSVSLFARKGLSPSTATLSSVFRFIAHQMSQSYNPGTALTAPVWADPRSLAATCGITFVFFSSGYLDVSVPRVAKPYGLYRLHRYRFPHSDIYGSTFVCNSP